MRGAAAAIERLAARGWRLGTAYVRSLLDSLGAPDRAYPLLLVAGTNGKGSVAAMAAGALGAAGLKVGLYTSPHLVDVRERIVVDGEAITPEALEDLWGRCGQRLVAAGATYFEATTALSLLAFAEAGVEAAVLEVGMGGRLDATNATDPLVSVVVGVALEHTEVLGPTVEAIAREKAAVARPGRPLVTSAEGAALAVIQAEAARIGARLVEVGPPARPRRLRLGGAHQQRNAETAAVAGRLLIEALGRTVPEGVLEEGLANVRWPGRLETVDRPGGSVVVDCAHNPDGAEALAAAIRDGAAGPLPAAAVFNVRAPRDPAAVAAPLLPIVERWIVPRLADAKGLPPEAVSAGLRAAGADAATAPPPGGVPEALEVVRGAAAIAFGSVYLAGEALATLGAWPSGLLWRRASRSPASSSSPSS